MTRNAVVPFVVLLCGLSSTVSGQGVSERQSLRGVDAIRVFVEDIPLEVEQVGLTKETLLTGTELRLRVNQIPISSSASNVLRVNLQLLRLSGNTEGLYAYRIDLELYQYVVLPDGEAFLAATWDRGGVGTIGRENLPDLHDDVEDLVDAFSNDYLAANPR